MLPAMLLALAPVQGPPVWGEVSLGKFYTYDVAPDAAQPDRWGFAFADGTRLTDEELGDATTPERFVGWDGAPVTVTLDLGKAYAISHVTLRARSETDAGVAFPPSVTFETSVDGASWTPYGAPQSFPPDTAGFSAASVVGDGGWAGARHVRAHVASGGAWTHLDELVVEGTIEHTWKHVPETGCLHAAFPTEPYWGGYYVDLPVFEGLAGKSVAQVLWYVDWEQTFHDSMALVLDQLLDGRAMQVGWMPYETTTAQLAAGSHDAFLVEWLTAAAKKGHPLFLRPMSEFNGSWTWPGIGDPPLHYGGDPQSFRWAWRRMVNIAERVGATGEDIVWVWSPNAKTYPDEPWNQPMEYYPGDAFVDWVGLSVYYPQESTPAPLIQPYYDQWAGVKPLMIAEGGGDEHAFPTPAGKPWWIGLWFTQLRDLFPEVKVATWFHLVGAGGAPNFRVDSTPEALAAYRAGVADPWFVGHPPLLTATPDAVSLAGGGAQTFGVDAGEAYDGDLYFVLGSLTGTSPGPVLDGHEVPLVFDLYTQVSIDQANTGPFVSTAGLLDGDGRATAALSIPPGAVPTLAGRTAWHAALVVDVSENRVARTGEAVALQLLP